jgi:DnaJ-class molecular chaperone
MADDLYSILSVERGADAGEIRKAWMRLAKTHHPDRGGDAEQFKKIQMAFEVLSDDERRRMYDVTGQIPGQGGGGGGGGGPAGSEMGGFPGFHFDIGNLFGMFGGMGVSVGPDGRSRKRPGKPHPKVERIGVTLAQFYNGHVFNICLDRTKICGTCGGDGAKRKEQCANCRGSGVFTQAIHVNGMTMHSRGPCTQCAGKGTRTIDICDDCIGSGKQSEKKALEARVAPGMQPGRTAVFQEACSEMAEFEIAGDLHIILDSAPDQNGWVRIGNKQQHLETAVTLSLAESLVGCNVRLTGHPAYDDGLFVKIPAASFAGDTYCITGLGMPIEGEAGRYGDLHIKINVQVKMMERRMLSSDIAQQGLEGMFRGLCRVPDGFEDGQTEVQQELYLTRS